MPASNVSSPSTAASTIPAPEKNPNAAKNKAAAKAAKAERRSQKATSNIPSSINLPSSGLQSNLTTTVSSSSSSTLMISQASPIRPTSPSQQTPNVVAMNTRSFSRVTSTSQIAVPVQTFQRQSSYLFSHLDRVANPTSLNPRASASNQELHPSITRLALLLPNMGSTARLVAMCAAFADVLRDYNTPTHTHITRHFNSHLLPHINALVVARPLCVGMANTIRWLKTFVPSLSADLSETDAKVAINTWLSNLIRDKVEVAEEMIADSVGTKINPGEVVLVYGRSKIVQKSLLLAHSRGIAFHVICVDSTPSCQGKKLLRTLVKAGVECSYSYLHAVSTLMNQATLLLLGTDALLSNGALYATAGTASVAMMAKKHMVPVLVACHTIKYKEDRVGLSSLGDNELGSIDEISARYEDSEPSKINITNLLYDTTPPEYISALVTEVGIIPACAVGLIRSG